MGQFWRALEKVFGSLKFAVTVILIFAVCMMAGTILESYCGADFASRALYKTWAFMLLQALMYLSIAVATLVRLPFKKNLYGFYTIHLGLLTIGAGSLITYLAGVDGQVTLNPLTPTREISLSRDVVTITRPSIDQKITYYLPPAAFVKNLNDEVRGIKLKEYLPFSESKDEWQTPDDNSPANSSMVSSAHYLLWNNQVSENFILSTNPRAKDYDSTINLGPLSVHYLPEALGDCFSPEVDSKNPSGIIIWNAADGTCFAPETKAIEIKSTKSGSRFLAFKTPLGIVTFFPDVSPWPMKVSKDEFKPFETSPYRIFSKKIFAESPQLLLFGKTLAYQDKSAEKKWVLKKFDNKEIELPWMGFKIQLLRYEKDLYPAKIPYYQIPAQKNGQLVKGGVRALKLEVEGKDFWVTNMGSLVVNTKNEEITFELKKETLTLPFELVLEKFKMDKDPGTDNPASFESFVKLFDAKENKTHHIYMNNPLKYQNLTFYQASYFQTENGEYGSVLSANIDQGRPYKYLGSMLLVFGAVWHYIIRRKKTA